MVVSGRNTSSNRVYMKTNCSVLPLEPCIYVFIGHSRYLAKLQYIYIKLIVPSAEVYGYKCLAGAKHIIWQLPQLSFNAYIKALIGC